MELLSGNEAIACGARDAGVSVASAYPGTPSTETLEAFAKFDGVYAEWATNEKVALEVALGASAAGARTLFTCKHVGVNVAADPLFTAAYTGVGGGLVMLAADDPGMYSSQNEQDSHFYAAASSIPMLDPADSQEAYDFTREAYEISERFDVPVFIRSTVRVSHTQTPVQTSPAVDFTHKTYESKPQKWVMMPANAKGRRIDLLTRNDALKTWAYDTPLNKVERAEGGSKIGVICAGAVYQHVKAALPDADVLKLGVTFPISETAVREFADSVEQLFVIEEASTYLRDAIRACGVHVSESPFGLTEAGELSPNLIKAAFGRDLAVHADVPSDVPPRPPALCAGCPHRLVFKELSRKKAIVTGDIGCYTLGALPPLSCIDTCVDMGASVSMAHGMELAFAQSGSTTRPVVAVIGDSTFAHSGLSSLISTFYNGGTGVVCVLDNRTTAMTGRQGNPFNGTTLQNRPSHELDIEAVVRAIGVTDVRTVNPNVMQDVREAIGDAVANKDELSVIVFKSPCILLERNYLTPYSVASCTGCGVCVTLGCPAIGKDAETGLAYIDATACIGCGQCAQYCRFNAITNN